MLKYKQYLQHLTILNEESSVDDVMLGHLSHGSDVFHEQPEYGHHVISWFEKAHKVRMGEQVSDINLSLKHDGGVSGHFIYDEQGPAFSDKHRMARKDGPVLVRTPEQVDAVFGDKPGYAASIKHLLQYIPKFLKKGSHVQGDTLYSPREGKPESHRPNLIEYSTNSKAPVGIAIHTQITNGVSHTLEDGVIKSTPSVHIPEHKYTPDPETYSIEARKAVTYHLDQAKKLLKDHTTDHLLPKKIREQYSVYLNRMARGHDFTTGTIHAAPLTPTVDGFINHMRMVGHDEINKVKNKEIKHKEYADLISHIDNNRAHFQRSINIREHMRKATDNLVSGIKHPDIRASLNGRDIGPEGLVLAAPSRQLPGKYNAAIKFVHSSIQYGLGNNDRFPPVVKAKQMMPIDKPK